MILDHFGIIDKELRLYISVGSNHPVHGVIAYLKYVPTSRGTLWCYNNVLCFERVLKHYSVDNIKQVSIYQTMYYDPYHGSQLPIVPKDHIIKILDPRERVLELIKTCNDNLEDLALDFLTTIHKELGIPWSDIGLTGSLLFKIHNLERSDIDIVIYGKHSTIKFVNSIKELGILNDIPYPRYSVLIENLVRLHRIPTEVAKMIYSIPRRGIFRNREVTIVFSHDKPLPLNKNVIEQHCIEALISVEPKNTDFLLYPTYSKVYAYYVNNSRFNDYIEFLSYESAYSIPLYFGGTFRVRGLLQKLSDGSFRLVLGVRECDNYLRRAD